MIAAMRAVAAVTAADGVAVRMPAVRPAATRACVDGGSVPWWAIAVPLLLVLGCVAVLERRSAAST